MHIFDKIIFDMNIMQFDLSSLNILGIEYWNLNMIHDEQWMWIHTYRIYFKQPQGSAICLLHDNSISMHCLVTFYCCLVSFYSGKTKILTQGCSVSWCGFCCYVHFIVTYYENNNNGRFILSFSGLAACILANPCA